MKKLLGLWYHVVPWILFVIIWLQFLVNAWQQKTITELQERLRPNVVAK